MPNNDWGIYYDYVGDKFPNGIPTSNVDNVPISGALDMATTLSLYLYGTKTVPVDPVDRIRAVDSKAVKSILDFAGFMQGPGTLLRAAATVDDESLVRKLYAGELDSYFGAVGSAWVSLTADALGNLNTSNKRDFTYQHVDFQNRANWIEETFIWNSVTWTINPDAVFRVRLNSSGVKEYEISNLKFTIQPDNYDYVTDTPDNSNKSQALHGSYHDPFNIGKRFEIDFDTHEVVEPTTWNKTLYDLHNSNAVTWGYSNNLLVQSANHLLNLANWGLQGSTIAQQLALAGGPIQYQSEGKPLLLGTAQDDIIRSSLDANRKFDLSNGNTENISGTKIPGAKSDLFPYLETPENLGVVVYSGDGADQVFLSRFDDKVFGGKGNDVLMKFEETFASGEPPDIVRFLGGNDIVHGGDKNTAWTNDGSDTVTYNVPQLTQALQVRFTNEGQTQNGGPAIEVTSTEIGKDLLYSIENLALTAQQDSVIVTDPVPFKQLQGVKIDGGAGPDTIDFSGAPSGAFINLPANPLNRR